MFKIFAALVVAGLFSGVAIVRSQTPPQQEQVGSNISYGSIYGWAVPPGKKINLWPVSARRFDAWIAVESFRQFADADAFAKQLSTRTPPNLPYLVFGYQAFSDTAPLR